MSYDGWKSTDVTDSRELYESCETVETPEVSCDCGQPLDGGKDGLCVDCVHEAHEFAADCADKDWI